MLRLLKHWPRLLGHAKLFCPYNKGVEQTNEKGSNKWGWTILKCYNCAVRMTNIMIVLNLLAKDLLDSPNLAAHNGLMKHLWCMT